MSLNELSSMGIGIHNLLAAYQHGLVFLPVRVVPMLDPEDEATSPVSLQQGLDEFFSFMSLSVPFGAMALGQTATQAHRSQGCSHNGRNTNPRF